MIGLIGAFVMGAVFAAVQIYEWSKKNYRIGTSSYASLYFTTTGLHMAHVFVGLVILATLALWVGAGLLFAEAPDRGLCRGIVLALRRRGLVVRVHDVLHHAIPGVRTMSEEQHPAPRRGELPPLLATVLIYASPIIWLLSLSIGFHADELALLSER